MITEDDINKVCIDTVRRVFHSPYCGVAGHQIKEFDNFIDHDIDSILSHLPSINALPVIKENRYQYSISFDYAEISKPARYLVKDGSIDILTPSECRMSNLTYSSTLFIHATMKKKHQDTGETIIIEERLVPFGRIPIMLGSKRCITRNMNVDERIRYGECLSDSGGYFIINGSEKVLMGQERALTHNLVFVSVNLKAFSHKAEIRCVPKKGRNANRTSNTAVCFTKEFTNTRLQSKAIYRTFSIIMQIPQLINIQLPIFIFFVACGCADEEQFCKYLPMVQETILRNCIGEAKVAIASMIKTNDKPGKSYPSMYSQHVNCTPNYREQTINDALEYIGRQSMMKKAKVENGISHSKSYYITKARDIIANEVLPQISEKYNQNDNHQKLCFLAYMIHRIQVVKTNNDDKDDRDHLMNKRVDLSSSLLSSIMKNALDRAMKNIGRDFFRTVDNPHKLMNFKKIIEPYGIYITEAFRYSIQTGRWGDKKVLTTYKVQVRIGVTQPLNRFMPLAALSQIRKVNTPSGRDNTLAAPRQLHGTHFGKYCPSETPEGHSCGLVRTLSILTIISSSSHSDVFMFIDKYLQQIGLVGKSLFPSFADHKIFIDGVWKINESLNVTESNQLVHHLRYMRRMMQIDYDVGIVLYSTKHRKEIHIQTDAGRLLRPLFIADQFFFNFEDTLKKVDKLIQSESGLHLLMEEGIIEYVGADEEESLNIAENLIEYSKIPDTTKMGITHIEIHGVTILGLCALDVPYSAHSQAPRVSYQCLHYEEEIMMADKSIKAIKDIQIGEQVLTFNTDTLLCEPSKVLNQYVKKTNKEMVEVSTDTNKTIRVTTDHCFWTEGGWMQANNLLGIKVAIFGGELKQKGDASFTNIVAIKPIKRSTIADITVKNPHHTFITSSGFGVHNSSMMKQAIGVPTLNYQARFDASSHILNYPQKPLSSSSRWLHKFSSEDKNYNRLQDDLSSMFGASGQNAIVAICSWTGYNQEDSVIINQSAIDRGLFRSTICKTTLDTQRMEEIYRPPTKANTTQRKKANYDKLDIDGIAAPGEVLDIGDAYVGKVVKMSRNENKRAFNERDLSLIHQPTDRQRYAIDAIAISTHDNHHQNIDFYDVNSPANKELKKKIHKIKMRTERIPEIGDKFCKYHFFSPSLSQIDIFSRPEQRY